MNLRKWVQFHLIASGLGYNYALFQIDIFAYLKKEKRKNKN